MNLAITDGTIIDERYEVSCVLGQGGMGSVYEARQTGLERKIAIKILHPSLVQDKDSFARFNERLSDQTS